MFFLESGTHKENETRDKNEVPEKHDCEQDKMKEKNMQKEKSEEASGGAGIPVSDIDSVESCFVPCY